MKQLQFDDADIKQMKVLVNLLKMGKWDLTGEAIPMVSDAMVWAVKFCEQMKKVEDVKDEDVLEVVKPEPRKRK